MAARRKLAAGTIGLLLALQPTFGQESAQPTRPPSTSEQVNPQQGQGRVEGNLELLTDTQGVDFGPYLSRVASAVRKNWYAIIPHDARPPLLKSGTVAIQFVLLPNGKIAGLQYTGSSGDMGLDRAAWGGITASDPFAPLPKEFHGPYLALRFHFYYNPAKTMQTNPQSAASPAPTSTGH
jgi:TonB family protein